MISSLPGKALKTLVDITWLVERFNIRSYRRVAEFHMRLTFLENIPHRHKG